MARSKPGPGRYSYSNWYERDYSPIQALTEAPDPDSQVTKFLKDCPDAAAVVERVKAITGRIDLVHCNDSRDGFGSGADRHANLGDGQIDRELLLAVVAALG